MLNVLCIGDVVGKYSCEYLQINLPNIKRKYNIDVIIANGENSADGNGITPFSAKQLFNAGVDIITGGNHTLKRKEMYDFLECNPYITVPHNINNNEIGQAISIYDMGAYKLAVINICGTVYMDNTSNAFECADLLLDKVNEIGAKIIIVDFHAEATSEKRALGLYLDGKVSALFGTHTHIPTADLTILPNGTGYITDLGMCGPEHSVLGVESNIIINRFKGISFDKFVTSKAKTIFNGCIFSIDTHTGKTIKCEQLILK